MAHQSETMQAAYDMERAWNDYSGYLMLGAACGLSAIIIVRMAQGIVWERRSRSISKAVGTI